MQPVSIKGMEIGEGAPKTIISLMGSDAASIKDVIAKGKEAGVDCYEWRGDFCAAVHDSETMAKESKEVAAMLPDNPLLFTFRSTSQGGQLTIPADEYVALNKAVIEAEAVDMVDIESWIGDARVLELVDCAQRHGVKTVISYHNFAGTPSIEWMVELLTHFVDMGADIPKIAVMAKDASDALKLLAATDEVSRLHFDGPLLTMAMGREGSITRLAGELFGSALTFCSLEQASAPGQVAVTQAREIMDALHEVIAE